MLNGKTTIGTIFFFLSPTSLALGLEGRDGDCPEIHGQRERQTQPLAQLRLQRSVTFAEDPTNQLLGREMRECLLQLGESDTRFARIAGQGMGRDQHQYDARLTRIEVPARDQDIRSPWHNV